MRPTTLFIAAALALSCAACGDRRDDPEVDPSSTGVTSSPGERQATTPASANDPDPASAQPSMPPAQNTPDCSDAAAAGDPACRATPTQTPPVQPSAQPPQGSQEPQDSQAPPPSR